MKPMPEMHPDTSSKKVPPRIEKADNSFGTAGVDTPWANSHHITKGGGPHWQTHHQNSQGLAGQTDWQHKGAKRGDKSGPEQRSNPWTGINTPNTTDPKQSATE